MLCFTAVTNILRKKLVWSPLVFLLQCVSGPHTHSHRENGQQWAVGSHKQVKAVLGEWGKPWHGWQSETIGVCCPVNAGREKICKKGMVWKSEHTSFLADALLRRPYMSRLTKLSSLLLQPLILYSLTFSLFSVFIFFFLTLKFLYLVILCVVVFCT